MQLILQIFMGLSLSAVTGLRAFLPLLVLSILSYNKIIILNSKLSFLSTKEAIIIFSIATISEILADKIPAFDHFLDSINTFIKPIAAALVAGSVITKLPPLYIFILAVIVGGSISFSVNGIKAASRVVSTATTFTTLNPVISIGEDILAFLTTALSIFFPIIAFIVIIIIFISIYFIFKKLKLTKSKLST